MARRPASMVDPGFSRRFQFPPEFDQAAIPVFNTNTSLITVEALADPGALTWLVVEKCVDGESVIQFERLYHELSAHVATTYLVVPRSGPRGRFLPVKEPTDLDEIAAPPARDARLGPGVPLGALSDICDSTIGWPIGTRGTLSARIRHTRVTESARRVGSMDVLQLVLPRRCGICGRIGESACSDCLRRLVRCVPPLCERCGAPGPWPVRRCAECSGRRLAFARARAALVYESHARAFVSTWKERGRRDLATVAASIVSESVARPDVDVITFVPGDRDRGLRRGHVPAAALAAGLAELWELPLQRAARPVDLESGVNATCRARNGVGTSRTRSRSGAPCHRRSASSTTSTRRDPRPRLARRRCVAWEQRV